MTDLASIGISRRALVQARWLFGTAAVYNMAGALSFLFLRPWLTPFLHLNRVEGANLPTLYLACGFVILFAGAYIFVAVDPVRYRPYIPLAVVGKLMAVASFVVPWMNGQVSWTVVATTAGDPVYLVLFLLYLRGMEAR